MLNTDEEKRKILAVGVFLLVAVFSWYYGSVDESDISDDAVMKDVVSEDSTTKDSQKKDGHVMTIKGAKLAEKDGEPANPFDPAHATKSNSEAGRASAGKAKVDNRSGKNAADSVSADVNKQNNNIVKKMAAEKVKKKAVASEKEDSKLELTGIMSSGSAQAAIICLNGKQLALCLGESSNGITLISVTNSSAVVERDGCQQEIYLQ